jgi:MYXO-CTERM domain-containing protein
LKYLLIVAAISMVLAAGGLSSVESDDYCSMNGSGSTITLLPPGWHCEPYSGPEASGPPNPDTGNALGFLAILAAGLLLVFRRRTKTAVAVAIVLGVMGAGALFAGFMFAFTACWVLGTFLSLLVTRNVVAAATAALAGMAVGVAELFAGSVGIAIVLLLLILIPQRAEVLVPNVRSH